MANPNTPQRIRGTQDMLGETVERFQHVVSAFERVRRLYGFQRVEVPIFEATDVFARSLGETTDVVGKEMYSFPDRGGDSLTLRPEFTAGIARAYLTNGWQQHAPLKLATHGPAFRYERPQKGRFRQFHQIDAEVIGAGEPQADVELLAFADQLLKELGIAEGVTLRLNTLGDSASREAWRQVLIAHFEGFELSEDSRDRLQRNPLRILDSKDPRDRPAADSAPEMVLSGEAEDFFAKVREGLDAAGVAYTLDPRLVRGLDYYRHTAFEFVTDRLGAQGTVLGGGRYDGLMETLGGPHTPAVGWAAGIERLADLLDENLGFEYSDFAIVVEADTLFTTARSLAQSLRYLGRSVEVFDYGPPRKRFDKAKKRVPRVFLVLDDYATKFEQLGSLRIKPDELDGITYMGLLASVAAALSHLSLAEVEADDLLVNPEVPVMDKEGCF